MKIIVIGDSMTDKYSYGEVTRNSPEDANISVVDMLGKQDVKLGGCLNVCANLKTLGADEVYVASILDSNQSNILKFYYNIKCDLSSYIPESNSLVKERIIDVLTNKQIARLDHRKRFEENDLCSFKKFISERAFLNDFDAIVISDYDKGIIDNYWLSRLSHTSKPIFVDTKKTNLSIWNSLENCIIKINQSEYKNSQNSYNVKHPLIVTNGKAGSKLWLDNEESVLFETQPVEEADTVGAGDVFLSGLVVNYLKTNDLVEATKYATKAATASVRKKGTCTVSQKEIDQEKFWEERK